MSLPLSQVSIAARRSALAASRSAKRTISLPRADGVRPRHSLDWNACAAAATARSTSLASQRGISAQGLPVKGSKLSKVAAACGAEPATRLE
jgi:hypothetical protein